MNECRWDGDVKCLKEPRELSIELHAGFGDLWNTEAAELRARLVGGEPGGAVCVFPDHGSERGVEHGAGVVAEHPLGDDVVAHQVPKALGVVAGCLHEWVRVVLGVDEEAVRGAGFDQLDHL